MQLLPSVGALPTRSDLVHLVIGGTAGLIVWEIFARFVTPIFVGGPLQPASLVILLFQTWTGWAMPWALAEVIHYATGILFYPIGYWVTSRWIVTLGTLGDGLLWGVITWILALGVFATLAGLPFMLGFIKLSWFSLIGHCIYALIAVALTERLIARRQEAAAMA